MKRLTRYELVAFISGFSLLAYELAAARILSPSIGSSTYVWTSVIGVIIAALSIGYAVGGVLADKRVKPTDIAGLLLAAAAGVVATLLLSDPILSAIGEGIQDPRLQGMVAATLLFTPTSFILGVISPYLARLRTVSVETTGTSVALLNAANAIGGIIGTFSVGFIFFGYIGSKETLIFTAVLLAAASLFFAPFETIIKRVGIISIWLLIAAVVFPAGMAEGEIADIDTPSARYKVRDINYGGQPVRVLVSGPRAAQSGIFLNGSDDLVFFYTKKMAELVKTAPKKDRILVLGGGAFTLPEYLGAKYPASRVDVVEIDPRLRDISKEFFQYQDLPNVRIVPQDARAFLNGNDTQYGVILVDVYSDNAIPFSVSSGEYAARLKENLTPGGLVAVNIIGTDTEGCRPLLRALHGSYARHFANYQLYPQLDPSLQTRQNIIFAYSDTRLDDPAGAKPDLSGGRPLTDNFAPVERLKLECQQSEK